MSKPVKALLRKELVRRLTGVDSLAVLSLVGIDGVTNNRLRQELLAKDVRVTVVKNSIARQAFKEKIKDMQFIKEFKENSTLTEEDALELGRKVSKSLAKKYSGS